MYLADSGRLGAELEEGFGPRADAVGMSEAEKRSALNANMATNAALGLGPGTFARAHGDRRWLVAQFEADDVVFHQALMVHASAGDRDPEGKIRLSCDVRYADRLHEYDARWDARWDAGVCPGRWAVGCGWFAVTR